MSDALRDPDPKRAQDRLHILSAGWAGGTRIGESLAGFNRDHAAAPRAFAHGRHRRQRRLRHAASPKRLANALGALARRARRIVWLNPLVGSAGFTPTSRGMQAALPHLDLLAPGADLASIERALPKILDTLS